MKTRTKALIPVVVLTAGKPIVARLARRRHESHRKRRLAALAAGLGAVGGLLYWLRHRSKGTGVPA